MSPKRAINGPRPFPLRIKKDSHINKKPSIPNSQSSSAVSSLAAATNPQNPTAEHHRPKIIYVHSPKIIHAEPRDFMALVQRLTGFNSSDHNADDESSSLTEEIRPINNRLSSPSPKFDVGPNQFLADVPLFTPNSTDFFLSPRTLYRFADTVSVLPNLGNLMMSSPSGFDAKKELRQY